MHTLGRFEGIDTGGRELIARFALDGKPTLPDELEALRDKRLVIDCQPFREKRSDSANRYFWQLVDRMAKVLGVDKWTWYLRCIREHGVFVDMSIDAEAIPRLQRQFRYIETFDDGYEGGPRLVRCYFGSSQYDSREMAELIDGTVREAQELGIETLTPDEIAQMIALMDSDAARAGRSE